MQNVLILSFIFIILRNKCLQKLTNTNNVIYTKRMKMANQNNSRIYQHLMRIGLSSVKEVHFKGNLESKIIFPKLTHGKKVFLSCKTM